MIHPTGFAHGTLWRVFPWDESAPEGAPHSVRSVAPARLQNYGRFDLGGDPLVLYLAESPIHAAAETLRGLLRAPSRDAANRHTLTERDLMVGGHRRALVRVRLPPSIAARVPDMNEGAALQHFGLRADQLSSNLRSVTQAAARTIHTHPDSVPGFVWSSRFGGDWHVVLLFLDRVAMSKLSFATPEPLHLHHPAVRDAAENLGLDLAERS